MQRSTDDGAGVARTARSSEGILAEWKLSGFERLTGRTPRPEGPIVPARRGRPRNANHALRRFHEDLDRIGLRARRQHDARRTFISIARADGAVADTLHFATHGPDGDIMDEYTTLPWPALCAEVAKVRISLREGKLLEMPRPIALAAGAGAPELLTPLLTGSGTFENNKGKLAERTGLEPWQRNPRAPTISRFSSHHTGLRAAAVPAGPR